MKKWGAAFAAPHHFPVHLAARVRESDPSETSTVRIARLCRSANKGLHLEAHMPH